MTLIKYAATLLDDFDDYILLRQVLVIAEHGIFFGLDHHVLQRNAIDRHLGQTVELHGATGIVADNILDVDIAEDGGLLVHRHLGLSAASSFLLKLRFDHAASRYSVSHDVMTSIFIFRRPVTFSAQ